MARKAKVVVAMVSCPSKSNVDDDGVGSADVFLAVFACSCRNGGHSTCHRLMQSGLFFFISWIQNLLEFTLPYHRGVRGTKHFPIKTPISVAGPLPHGS